MLPVMADEEDDWAALAAYVRERRQALELSVKDAYTQAGMKRSWWYQLEKGVKHDKAGRQVALNVRLENLAKAARVLGVELADLRRILAGGPPP